MRWIIDDLKKALAQLRRWQTWLVIGLIGLFSLLAYLVGSFALRTDSVLIFMRYNVGACREMTNGSIIFLFCGMIFFFFAALLTLGEFQRYFEFRQRNAHYQARQALFWGSGWATLAVVIAGSALIFFTSYCR